eukprot:scaffold17047_cov104-Isochrysis_galbana.AAC.4
MLTRDAQHRAATSVVLGDVLLELHRTFALQVTQRLPHVPQYPQAIHLLGITFQLRFTLGCVAAPAKANRQLSLPAPRGPARSRRAPAQWSTSLGTRGVCSFPHPLVPSLPPRHVLGKCACFCAEGIGSPSPAKEGGGLSCGGANNNEPHVKQ